MSSLSRIRAGVFAASVAALVGPAYAQQGQDNPVIVRANELKAQAQAETEAYNAAKARSEAQAAAAKAAFGTLGDYQNAGTIEVGANSGKLEVALLASEATRLSARRIVHEICQTSAAALVCNAKAASDLIIVTDADKPTFDSYDAFRLQLLSIEDELKRARSSACAVGRPAVGAQIVGTAGIATAVNIAANLLRSEYKLSYVELTPNDAILLKAFLENARPSIKATLWVPSLLPQRIDLLRNPALVELKRVMELRDEVSKCASGKTKRNTADSNGASKAVERFDGLYAKLGTSDDKGVVPLAVVARQAHLGAIMDKPSTYALLLKQEMAGGSAYAKKNFATFLGAMPFFVSGGSLVTYTLQKTDTGGVVHAGILPQTRPFMRIHEATQRYLGDAPAK